MTIARHEGNNELSQTIFDPNVFVLGTSAIEHYDSVHKRNYAKTLLLQEEKLTEIERTNKILFDKMNEVKGRKQNITTLMTHTGKTSISPPRPKKALFKKVDPLKNLTKQKQKIRRMH